MAEDVRHSVVVEELSETYGRRYQSACQTCEWKGDKLYRADEAQRDSDRHFRLLAGKKGIYECGCSPDDREGYGWKPLGRRKRCPKHRKPYIPKNPRKPLVPPVVSTEQILEALRRKHMDIEFRFQRPWFFIDELRLDTGFAGDSRRGGQRAKQRQLHDSKGQPRFDEQGRPMMKLVHGNATRLDAFACHLWRSGDFERIAYEIKVSRSDFLNEIQKPWKREPGMAVSHRFYYVTPPGLLQPSEVPEGCGLMEVHPSGHVKTRVKAPFREQGDTVPIGFFTSLVRRLQKMPVELDELGA